MKRDSEITRRRFLEHTSVAVGAAALGACSSDEPSEDQPDSAEDSAEAGSSGARARRRGSSASDPAGAGRAASAPSGEGGRSRAADGGSADAVGAEGPEAGSGAEEERAADGAAEPAADGGGAPAAGSGVTVAVVARGSDLDATIARAVELAGGLSAIQPGQSVFIKVNAVSDRMIGATGIRTDPEFVAAVVRLVKQRNPGRIIVGDRSARQFPDTAGVFEASGLGEAVMAAGADEVYPARSPEDAPDEWMMLQPSGYEGTWGDTRGLYAMRKILEADHLINVPTCKNHRLALFSLSMKNFIGAIGDPSRGPLHFGDSAGANFGPIGRDIAVLNQMFKPLMNILDATHALVNGGPQGDGSDAVRAEPGLVVASTDRAALDAMGVSIIQHELETAMVPMPDGSHEVLRSQTAWSLPQIQGAIELGLGVASASEVTLAFEGVAIQEQLEMRYRA